MVVSFKLKQRINAIRLANIRRLQCAEKRASVKQAIDGHGQLGEVADAMHSVA